MSCSLEFSRNRRTVETSNANWLDMTCAGVTVGANNSIVQRPKSLETKTE